VKQIGVVACDFSHFEEWLLVGNDDAFRWNSEQRLMAYKVLEEQSSILREN